MTGQLSGGGACTHSPVWPCWHVLLLLDSGSRSPGQEGGRWCPVTHPQGVGEDQGARLSPAALSHVSSRCPRWAVFSSLGDAMGLSRGTALKPQPCPCAPASAHRNPSSAPGPGPGQCPRGCRPQGGEAVPGSGVPRVPVLAPRAALLHVSLGPSDAPRPVHGALPLAPGPGWALGRRLPPEAGGGGGR